MESNSKEIRLENECGIDRISDMPDSILAKILSYLPTKYAVGTSILSTRWKNISPFEILPITLDLDDSLLLQPKENDSSSHSSSFIDFVDRLLNETLSDVPCVQTMILKCENNYGDAKIVSWVSAALRLNVSSLDLKFSLVESETLFRSLNGCTTLATLWLLLESELFLPDNFSLPNLTGLSLTKLIFNDEEGGNSINELIKGCPALELLMLFQCNLQCLEILVIECPLLKDLVIEDSYAASYCGLILDVPNLEKLLYDDFVPSIYSVSLSESLQLAHIDVGPNQDQLDELEEYSDDDVAMIVSSCASTIRLNLSACVIDSLLHSSLQLPVFQNLTWLSLGCLGLKWALLARLLCNAPNLQQLTLEEGIEMNEGEFANFKKLLPISPVCLELHMRRIELLVFKGDEDEIKLVEYFLKNGEVLQKLILHCLPLDDIISMLTRLLMLPKQSKTCQVLFNLKLE